jgi:hypothetical protein
LVETSEAKGGGRHPYLMLKILTQVRMHKSIYLTLNNVGFFSILKDSFSKFNFFKFTFDGIGKFFVAECWVPLNDVPVVREALETGVVRTFISYLT